MTDSDRDLLDRAAKAIGKLLSWVGEDGLPRDRGPVFAAGYGLAERGAWNPLEDDGDALRLAVRLGLTICNEHESAGVVHCTRGMEEEFPVVASGNVGDPPGVTPEDYAATRRAIVLAAAELAP